MPEMDMLGLGASEPAPAAPEGSDMDSELEMHMTTFMAAVKAGQARKAANALRNFVEACGSGEKKTEAPEGMY